MWIAHAHKDYELIDAGDGMKLERWGDKILYRPDPQAVWPCVKTSDAWGQIDAVYHRSSKGGGEWQNYKKLPDKWKVGYKDLTFNVGLMGFKHTGLFPEQAVNWDWMRGLIEGSDKEISVLNLFSYTGGATLACAKAGAHVVHVEASRGMVNWAKENSLSSGLQDASIRYIVDDCVKFVQREARRENRYHGIIMDPPSYGRGPKGETWKMEDMIFALVQDCMEVMDDKPLFFLINSYTTGLSPYVIQNILQLTVQKRFGGSITSDEIGLPITSSNLVLPCGTSGRWVQST